MSFTLDLQRFRAKASGRMDLVVRKVVLDLLSRVVLITPVDTGRARAGWSVGVNSVPSGTLAETDKTGSRVINKAKSIIKQVTGGDVVWIVNGVSYVLYLERGSSSQAPAGMVAVTLRNYPGIVEKATSEAKRERP